MAKSLVSGFWGWGMGGGKEGNLLFSDLLLLDAWLDGFSGNFWRGVGGGWDFGWSIIGKWLLGAPDSFRTMMLYRLDSGADSWVVLGFGLIFWGESGCGLFKCELGSPISSSMLCSVPCRRPSRILMESVIRKPLSIEMSVIGVGLAASFCGVKNAPLMESVFWFGSASVLEFLFGDS